MYRYAQKLYHSIDTSFVNYSKDDTTIEEFGGNEGADIDYSGTNTATTIQKLIRPIILACNNNVSSLLKIFGVDEVEMSPFLKDFQSPSALLKTYIDYSPSIFKFIMGDSSTTHNTAPDNTIGNKAPQETRTTKDACNINTLQDLIDL